VDPSDPSTALQDSIASPSQSWYGEEAHSPSYLWEETSLREASREFEFRIEHPQEDHIHIEIPEPSKEAFEPSEAPEPTQEVSATAPWLQSTFPAVPTREVDWDQIISKVTIILEKFGTPMMMDGGEHLGLTPGRRAVKGLETNSVLEHLGLRADTHYVRRLIRLVEQNLSICSHEPHEPSKRDGLVCVADGPASPAGNVVLYLLKPAPELKGKVATSERASPCLPPAPRMPPPAPPSRLEVLKKEEAESAAAIRVNTEFSKLLPHWRQKRSLAPKARIEAMKRWRNLSSHT